MLCRSAEAVGMYTVCVKAAPVRPQLLTLSPPGSGPYAGLSPVTSGGGAFGMFPPWPRPAQGGQRPSPHTKPAVVCLRKHKRETELSGHWWNLAHLIVPARIDWSDGNGCAGDSTRAHTRQPCTVSSNPSHLIADNFHLSMLVSLCSSFRCRKGWYNVHGGIFLSHVRVLLSASCASILAHCGLTVDGTLCSRQDYSYCCINHL